MAWGVDLNPIDERQRPVQLLEDCEEHRTARSLVGLRGSGQDHADHGLPVLDDPVTELGIGADRGTDESGGRETQV